MAKWICKTCGMQYPERETPPEGCPICLDQRQYIGHQGQQWMTLEEMQQGEYHNQFREYEPHLTGIGTVPQFAIGQRALLIETEQGNILWDCISYLDDETVERVKQLGGIKAIAISHPHFYSSMIEWAERFDARIYLPEADKQWVMRPSERITFWSGDVYKLTDAITLMRLGGHFHGSTVLHWQDGVDGKGALLTGDTIQVVADHNWLSFMYSYPNQIPLPAAKVAQMRDTVSAYDYERLYGGWFDALVARDAKNAVIRSANRYIEAVEHVLETKQGTTS